MSESTEQVQELLHLARQLGAGVTGCGKTFEIDLHWGKAVYRNDPAGVATACEMLARYSEQQARASQPRTDMLH